MMNMPLIWRSGGRVARSIIGRGTGLIMVAALLMGVGPLDRLPGARLVGHVVDAPVASWRFVEKAGQCELETRPEYPHSVTVNCWHLDGIGDARLDIGPRRPHHRDDWSNIGVQSRLYRQKRIEVRVCRRKL